MGSKISWTTEENNFLKTNYGVLSGEEIANHLGKTLTSIDARRRRLGIKAIGTGERMKKLYAEGNHPMQRKEVIEKFLGDKNPSCRQEVKDKISATRKKEYALGINKCGWHGGQKEPTKAESILMDHLVAQKFIYNLYIKGPRSINFHLDFANKDIMLCVEIDGSSHKNFEERDNRKDAFLTNKGWIVLRFTNDEVFANKNKVLREIAKHSSKLAELADRKANIRL